MKIILWNIRGLNGNAKHRLFKVTFSQEKSSILVAHETKCEGSHLEWIASIVWKYWKFIWVYSLGALWGLKMLWISKEITLLNFMVTQLSIATNLQKIRISNFIFITNFYDLNIKSKCWKYKERGWGIIINLYFHLHSPFNYASIIKEHINNS